MPRRKLPSDQKLAMQGLRISFQAKERLESLPTAEKKQVIAEMRKAVELVINSMTGNILQTISDNFASQPPKDNFLVDSP